MCLKHTQNVDPYWQLNSNTQVPWSTSLKVLSWKKMKKEQSFSENHSTTRIDLSLYIKSHPIPCCYSKNEKVEKILKKEFRIYLNRHVTDTNENQASSTTSKKTPSLNSNSIDVFSPKVKCFLCNENYTTLTTPTTHNNHSLMYLTKHIKSKPCN